MRIDHKKYAAMHPKSIAATTVLFNGAAAASAEGIPVGNAKTALVSLHLGTVSASQTGIALEVYTSSQTSNVSNAALISKIDDAIMALTSSNANGVYTGRIDIGNIEPVSGKESEKQYLYVKYAQETADAVLAECIVELCDPVEQPVSPVGASTAYTFDV